MPNATVLNENSKVKFYNELNQLENGDSISGRARAVKVREAAEKIQCFYCLDYQEVYKDREGMFANLDGRGDYDIINCVVCHDNSNWLSCSSSPTTTYPGIVKRGDRERSWIETKALGVGDNLVDKLSEKIGAL
tara:strand:+ start:1648 stop:2049 length:402 start_codon:yes stop_codon:yes gene_type:complete